MSMSSPVPDWALVVGCLVVLSAGAPGVGAALADDASVTAGDGSIERLGLAADGVAQTTPSANNSSVQHEDPDRTSERGDTSRLLGWLSGRLAGGLGGSLVELSQEEYELAEDHIGETWRKRLGQFVDVAGDTDDRDDDRAGEAFNETATTQREFVSGVQEYQRTLERFEEARANGNVSAIRRTARQLDDLAGEISRTNRSLVRNYQRLANLTGIEFENERRIVIGLTRNITEQQAEIRVSVFESTRLSVRGNRTSISFLDPLGLDGRLVASNGTGVGNETVTLAIDEQEIRVETDANGEFTTTYRPVGLPLEVQQLDVHYQPAPTAVYRSSNASVPVEVRQVTASLSLDVRNRTVAYGDRVRARVTATADETPVPGVSIQMSLAGTQLTSGTTRTDGEMTLSEPLPADIPPGSRTLLVASPWEGRAVAPESERVAVRVLQSETELTLVANGTVEAGIIANGTLHTTEGVPVRSQAVSIRAQGTEFGTYRTDGQGQFSGTIPVTELRSEGINGTVTLDAVFDARGTNLVNASAMQEITIEYPPASGEGSAGAATAGGSPGLVEEAGGFMQWLVRTAEDALRSTLDSLRGWVVDPLRLLGLVGIVAIAGIVLIVFGRALLDRRAQSEETSAPDYSDSEPPPAPDLSDEELLVNRARELLEDGAPAQSVADAYAAGRTRLTRSLDLRGRLTHREFLLAVSDRIDDAEYHDFAALADAYERSIYASEASENLAREALEAAADLVQSSGAEEQG